MVFVPWVVCCRIRKRSPEVAIPTRTEVFSNHRFRHDHHHPVLRLVVELATTFMAAPNAAFPRGARITLGESCDFVTI